MRWAALGRVGGGLVAALGLAAALAGCQKDEQANAPAKYTGPLFETENPIMLMSDSARLHVKLTGPLEQRFENGDVLYPKGALVTFYDKPGKLVINTLQSKWVRYDSNKQLYIMRGDVRVANVPQQQKLNTEELFYDRSKQTIYTDSSMFVRVETPAEVLTGRGLAAKQDFSRYRLFRPIGTFTLEEAKALGK